VTARRHEHAEQHEHLYAEESDAIATEMSRNVKESDEGGVVKPDYRGQPGRESADICAPWKLEQHIVEYRHEAEKIANITEMTAGSRPERSRRAVEAIDSDAARPWSTTTLRGGGHGR